MPVHDFFAFVTVGVWAVPVLGFDLHFEITIGEFQDLRDVLVVGGEFSVCVVFTQRHGFGEVLWECHCACTYCVNWKCLENTGIETTFELISGCDVEVLSVYLTH